MKAALRCLPFVVAGLLSVNMAWAATQDYSAQVCGLKHPQLSDGVPVNEDGSTGCRWSTPDGGFLSLTIDDSRRNEISTRITEELNQTQDNFNGVLGVTVTRAELGVCPGDDMLEINARGQSTVTGWTICGERIMVVSAEGAGVLDIARAMAQAARDGGW